MMIETKHGRTSMVAIALAVAAVISSPRMAAAVEAAGSAPNSTAASAAAPDMAALGQAYSGEVRPLVERYCHECHSAKRTEAEIDLSAFATWADVRKQQRVWQKVGEMLDTGQMPPKDARQPSESQRLQLQQWVRGYLTAEAAAQAGDPGRVVLRRLSNAEYTYTLRDLTGLDAIDPAREFPVDGAAGEGFMNTGSALVMSPSLVTKYLDAAKDVADHAMLVPDGFHFSPFTTSRDWTQETLAKIRGFYSQFTDAGGGSRVSLQGILIDTNKGGLLPVEKYLAATLAERESLTTGAKTIDTVARERGLSAKYLKMVWSSLNATDRSLVLDTLRTRWRASKPEDAAALTADVAAWQKALWTFAKVGQIGKVNGPKSWQEPVTPLTSKQELRFKIPAATDKTSSPQEVTLSLIASDAGDGNEQDFVIWKQPRLVAPGRSDLLLCDVRKVTRNLAAQRARLFPATAKYLLAADEAACAQDEPDAGPGEPDLTALAEKHGVEPNSLRAWLDYLGIGYKDATEKNASHGKLELRGLFTKPIHSTATYDFIQGWGKPDKPFVLANSSDQHVRIPGNMKPHGVAVHPSQKFQTAVGWRSPMTALMRVEATVTSANAECGNGVSWSMELRRGTTRQRLAAGKAQGYKPVTIGPIEGLGLRRGDLVSLLIGSRDGNDSCDLAAVDLKLTSSGDAGQTWNLADDVASNLAAANPHDDHFGNPGVWHFYSEVDKPGTEPGWVIPADSLLARWQTAVSAEARRGLAEEIQKLVTAPKPADQESPDAALHAQLTSFGGPLLSLGTLRTPVAGKTADAGPGVSNPGSQELGLDPALFGKHPTVVDADSICVHAPATITIRLPVEIAAGCELVTTAVLDRETGREGSVQLEVVAGQPKPEAGLHPSKLTVDSTNGLWTSDNRQFSFGAPILVNESSAARKRWVTAFDDFRHLFPAALAYAKIVPVDEVVTLTQYYREDDQLARLMLNDAQRAELDRLWDELFFVSREPLTAVDALAQLIEFATQDANPKVFEPLREPFSLRAAAFRQRLLDSEPKQLAKLVDFAGRVYRRPLSPAETQDIRALYGKLRAQELPHDEAFRLTLARMLVAPAFLYRVEQPGQGAGQGPVSDWELANRLSYFLWSSQPDAELSQAAADGQLRESGTLSAQVRRMLRDGKTRRLAIEFGCQWLHIHDFDHLDEKSERHFPTFLALRGAMYEESIQFFTDLFQNNGSVLDILDADYTFVNAELAKHYDIPVANGPPRGDASVGSPDWFRVSGIKQFGRGGILGQATTLAKQSGASRTSPILRGNWISEVLLGERLPRPPKGVPTLPDDESATAGLTVRQLVEKHSSDAKCSVCHKRIDPMGFSLENFDAIGRRREKDSGDRPIEARVTTLDGAQFEGLDGLRNYLLTARRDAFLRQFCRKLLGYSLGRSVQLSDEPLLTEMQSVLKTKNYKIVPVLETIVSSRQFREIRGIDSAYDD